MTSNKPSPTPARPLRLLARLCAWVVGQLAAFVREIQLALPDNLGAAPRTRTRDGRHGGCVGPEADFPAFAFDAADDPTRDLVAALGVVGGAECATDGCSLPHPLIVEAELPMAMLRSLEEWVADEQIPVVMKVSRDIPPDRVEVELVFRDPACSVRTKARLDAMVAMRKWVAGTSTGLT
jgi:hypothetical protein